MNAADEARQDLKAKLWRMREHGYLTAGGTYVPGLKGPRIRIEPKEEGMDTAVGNAVYESLNGAVTIVQHFKKMHGREPTDAEIRVAATLFIEENKQRRTEQISAERKARSSAPAHAAVDVPACPQCGGEMWDNRGRKKNPKAPDFRCKNENCLDAKGYQTGVWERDLKAEAVPSPVVPSSPDATFDAQDRTSDLPF